VPAALPVSGPEIGFQIEAARSRLRHALKKLRGRMGAYLKLLEPAR
jgi:hypothetical protein